MMTKRGSQTREPIENTDLVFLRFAPDGDDRVLRDFTDDSTRLHYELWTPSDDYAGYVIVIGGVGHEFVRRLTEAEVLAMP